MRIRHFWSAPTTHPRNEAKQRAANILNDLLAPEDEAAWEREQAEERRRKEG